MRLLTTLSVHLNPEALSLYLKSQGIENQVELATPTGETYRLWVHDEDQLEKANQIINEYKENPRDPKYSDISFSSLITDKEENSNEDKPDSTPRKKNLFRNAPYGKITLLIFFLTIVLFFWGNRQMKMPPSIPGVSTAPIMAPVDQKLLYDYPYYFQLRDELLKIYTPEQIEAKETPSPEAAQLIERLQGMTYWSGIYERIVSHFKNAAYPIKYSGPLFEKIRQGEVWRIFTPALLHFNLLHIFFNLVWFMMLGNQIEWRIGMWKYLILILLTGIISNTSQYLMSGSFFMGLSGIVCALAGFILARQQKAPWEGYLLHRTTVIFLAVFVFGIFFLQVVFFILQISGKSQLMLPIANTAHITGAFSGYLLGRLPLFSMHHKKKS